MILICKICGKESEAPRSELHFCRDFATFAKMAAANWNGKAEVAQSLSSRSNAVSQRK